MRKEELITLEINGRQVSAPKGVTVHRAAEINGIYIPTLCSHKDLSPFGGCRLCIVEIEGQRGYPLSCNTVASDGMMVTTENEAIRDLRREVLQLILSEHPSTCLVCDEKVDCEHVLGGTVRKSGVTTGCRWCPNESDCELKTLVELHEITELDYPTLYRGFEKERDDPFFDRDYNLCILCGRCVRMCQEVRGTGILEFQYRGPVATIGTAFGRSHLHAGCEFCGACVSVCPTGTLAEKASKWDGKPDYEVISTCPYCAIGCQLDMRVKDGRFSSAVASHDEVVNDAQACLKGSFCLGEVSHHYSRARKPMFREGKYWREKTWDEAFEIAVGKLKGLKSDKFAILVSPDLTNEALYMSQKFTRMVMGTNSIDSTARRSLSNRLGMWSELFSHPISIQGLCNASRILAIGLDTRFNFSIIGVEIRKAMKKGGMLVAIDPRENNLARYSDLWIQPAPGFEGTLLKSLAGSDKDLKSAAKVAGIDHKQLEEARKIIESGDDLAIILGPGVFHYSSAADLVEGIAIFSKRENTTILPLYTGTNARGAMEMGAFPEVLPGARGREYSETIEFFSNKWGGKLPTDQGITIDQITSGKQRPEVLYLVGAVPFFERPDCEFLIVQDIYEPDFECDLFLPSASFIESEGTMVNLEGRVQVAPRIETLKDSVRYGRARPDWWIFSNLANKLGVEGFGYDDVSDVQREIAEVVPGFAHDGDFDRASRTFEISGTVPVPEVSPKQNKAGDGKFTLVLHPEGYTHRGISITSKVEGLQILNPENGFYISEDDAESLGISEGDMLEIRVGKVTGKAPARIEEVLPKGVIYLFVPESLGGLASRKELENLFHLEQNPVSAEVKKSAV